MNATHLILGLCCAASLAGSSGCYRTRIDIGSGPTAAPQAPPNSDEALRWQEGAFYHGAVVGLVDLSGPLQLTKICPSGVDYIEQNQGFLASLARIVTGGLYTPLNVKVICKNGTSVQLSREQSGRLACQ